MKDKAAQLKTVTDKEVNEGIHQHKKYIHKHTNIKCTQIHDKVRHYCVCDKLYCMNVLLNL